MLHNCDYQEIIDQIPSESIDLVFCDPVYTDLEQYQSIFKHSARILKPNCSCIVYCSDRTMFDIQPLGEEYLNFVKPLYYNVPVKSSRLIFYKCHTKMTPALWFFKGKKPNNKWTIDTVINNGIQDSKYKWNKNEVAFSRWIRDFTERGDTVFDPTTGYGTIPLVCKKLGRKFIACEIDPEVYQKAKERIEVTQEELDYDSLEQRSIFDEEATFGFEKSG